MSKDPKLLIKMNKTFIGIFLLSAASLITEISLIRVFDVLFYPNISYMIISCALLAFGLAGVYGALRPYPPGRDTRFVISKLAILFSISVGSILPIMNLLPLNFNEISVHPLEQILLFSIMYASLAIPFFLVGLILTIIFSEYAQQIQVLYFWDLSGAALGSILLIPLISIIGPGGLLMVSSALGLAAFSLFSASLNRSIVAVGLSLLLILIPLFYSPGYLDFKEHQGKRGVKFARDQGMIEKTIWDPISKIDIINYRNFKYIAYDGGSQTSLFYPFDGNFQSLKDKLPQELSQHFWQRGVLASHYLKQGNGSNVLVIGSAGGQEIKAALLYGAKRIDAVELVGAVVKLGENEYSDYIGNLFHNPAVRVYIGEGRSFLRSNHEKYDIIQIFSNHTSSSVAAGTGAVATNYLQTSDAYREYFSHLSENGILHINHFNYSRMIITSALAWTQMGKKDFERHVVVFSYDQDETLPTLMIKMKPWSEKELGNLKDFFYAEFPGDTGKYTTVVDPLRPENNTIPLEYFKGYLPLEAIENAQVRISPATDNIPYFNFTQKSFNPFIDGFWQFVNNPFANFQMGIVTLNISGAVSLIYGAVFILIPLNFSKIGKNKWADKWKNLIYFSCLGAGFMLIEFIFIQLFMRLIGSPLYTYSTVIFTLLLSAAVGSFFSRRLRISPFSRWKWPFLGILSSIGLLLIFSPSIINYFLAAPVFIRILIGALIMFPVGFFLGMPFPLGILSLRNQPVGSIAWAWGANALFTVIGSLFGVILSLQWGYKITLLIACVFYTVALVMFSKMRYDPSSLEMSYSSS